MTDRQPHELLASPTPTPELVEGSPSAEEIEAITRVVDAYPNASEAELLAAHVALDAVRSQARGVAKRQKDERSAAACSDCHRPYDDEGFPDLIIPDWAWQQIAPEDGLLCPSCICKRLGDWGIKCEGKFTSGPLKAAAPSVTPSTGEADDR